MKTIISFLLLLLLLSQTSSAQQPLTMSNYDSVAMEEVQYLTQKLQLLPQQKAKVLELSRQYYQHRAALAPKLSAMQRQTSIAQYQSTKEKGFKEVFTESQWHSYQQLIQQRRQRMEAKMQELKKQRTRN